MIVGEQGLRSARAAGACPDWTPATAAPPPGPVSAPVPRQRTALIADRTSRPDLRGRTVAFLHAHPDDEAIFTGVAMHRLARRGARVVLITATVGEEGTPLLTPPLRGQTVADVRTAELERACAELGIARLVLLGYRDSGMAGTPANSHPRAFTRHPAAAVAGLADLLEAESAEALVHYDSGGIYGHPDHLAVHHLGRAAARLAAVPSYEATVDRDRLPATGRHLVERACPRSLRSTLGRSSAQISTVIQATPAELQAKQKAMAAHASQIPPSATATPDFAATYATEWFARAGAPGILDALGDFPAASQRDGFPPGAPARFTPSQWAPRRSAPAGRSLQYQETAAR